MSDAWLWDVHPSSLSIRVDEIYSYLRTCGGPTSRNPVVAIVPVKFSFFLNTIERSDVIVFENSVSRDSGPWPCYSRKKGEASFALIYPGALLLRFFLRITGSIVSSPNTFPSPGPKSYVRSLLSVLPVIYGTISDLLIHPSQVFGRANQSTRLSDSDAEICPPKCS